MKYRFKIFGLYLLLIGLTFGTTSAQLEQDLWFDGIVELESGGLVKGELSYYSDFESGLLQIKANGRTFSYNANQLVRFQFYDPQLRRERIFYSLPYTPPGNPNDVILFFEALLEGSHISILSKTEIRTQVRNATNNPYVYRGTYIPSWYNRHQNNSYSILMPYETIYLVTPSTEITNYNEPTALDRPNVKFKKAETDELTKLMRDEKAKIEAFLKENKFDLRERADMIRTVAYYNELKQKLAKND